MIRDNQSSKSLFDSAFASAREGKYVEAEELLQRLLKRHPEHPDVMHLLGVILLETGRSPECVEILQNAVLLRPCDARFQYHYGLALLNVEDIDGAEKAFHRTVDLDGDFHDARYNIAKIYKEKGDLTKAAAAYEELLARCPSHVDALFNLSNVCYEMDLLLKAEALLKKLLTSNPRHLNARVNLALIKDRNGQKDLAIEMLEAVLELDASHQLAQSLLRRFYSRSIASWHFDMINDEHRNAAYDSAIATAVSETDHVLEIGTGSGLLAMMAARAGARKVTTCEMVKPLANVARKIIAKNGYADRIQVIAKKSTQVQLGKDIDEPADVLIAEVFDNGLLGEHFLHALSHAKRNLLKKNAKIVPMAATVHAMLISCPQQHRINPVREIAGFDLSDFDIFRRDGYKLIDLASTHHQVLSEPLVICRLDFQEEVSLRRQQTILLPIVRSGTCHAVAFWYDLHLDESTSISTLNDAQTNHWKQAAQFFNVGYPVMADTFVELNVSQNSTGLTFELTVPNGRGVRKDRLDQKNASY